MHMIQIGSHNNAPTPQHKTQDIYIFSIDLSRPATPFCFEQSIGGGHVEQGGARWLALDELDGWPGEWREHLKKAGCAWVAELLDAPLPTIKARMRDGLIRLRDCLGAGVTA